MTQQLTHLIQNDKSVTQFIHLLHEIKSTNPEKQTKNICSLNQKDKNRPTCRPGNRRLSRPKSSSRFRISGKYHDQGYMGKDGKTSTLRVRY